MNKHISTPLHLETYLITLSLIIYTWGINPGPFKCPIYNHTDKDALDTAEGKIDVSWKSR